MKHNTSNIYNDVTVSILQSLNSYLQEVPLPTPLIVRITLFCSLNTDILSFYIPQKIITNLNSDSNFERYKLLIIPYPIISSANNTSCPTSTVLGRAFIYIKNKRGQRTEPCGNPHPSILHKEKYLCCLEFI
jgi:hypothetical protein